MHDRYRDHTNAYPQSKQYNFLWQHEAIARGNQDIPRVVVSEHHKGKGVLCNISILRDYSIFFDFKT